MRIERPKQTKMSDKDRNNLEYYTRMCVNLGLSPFMLDDTGYDGSSLTQGEHETILKFINSIRDKLFTGKQLSDEEIRQTKEYTSKYPGVY